MQNQVRVGIFVPIVSGGPLPSPEEFRAYCQEAERLGFESLWVNDRIFHRINVLDSLSMLTWAAAATQRVRLGTAVLLLALRSAALVAKTVSTLDFLSGGRAVLGVSLGGRDWEFAGTGTSVKQRVARLRENVAVLRRLMAEEQVSFEGRFQQLDGVGIRPKPVQPGGVPILFGGSHENSLRRTAELADGWVVGGGGGVEAFVKGRQRIQEFAAAGGRDLAGFEWGKLIYTAVASDREQGKRMLEPYLHAYYSPEYDIETSCVFGTAEECVEQLQPYAEGGLQTFILGPPSLDIEHLRRIARDVVPRLG